MKKQTKSNKLIPVQSKLTESEHKIIRDRAKTERRTIGQQLVYQAFLYADEDRGRALAERQRERDAEAAERRR